MDDPEPLSVEREGRLYVRGLREPLEAGGWRYIDFEIVGLRLYRTFSRSGQSHRFSGKVLLSRDTIGIAGQEQRTKELLFSCHSSPNLNQELEWTITFGFTPALDDYPLSHDAF
jgi:hypothetical protein